MTETGDRPQAAAQARTGGAAAPEAAAAAITAEFRAAGRPDRAVQEKAYLKSDLDFFGVGVPATRTVVRTWCRAHPGLGHDDLTGLAAALWAQPVFEPRMAAQMLLIQSLLLPLRRGAGDFARFSRYADQMLDEKEFFIRKAIGWVLRETAKKRPALVAGWLEPRITRVSGVTLREALKPLPEPTRATLQALRATTASRASLTMSSRKADTAAQPDQE